MSAQNSVGTNFQVETLNMTALDRGYMETGRELPGLFLVLISALSAAESEVGGEARKRYRDHDEYSE